MNVLMDICGQLAAGAPTGMKEYIEFNLAAFKAADKAVTLVEKHTDDILNLLMDIDKLFKDTDDQAYSFWNLHNDTKNSRHVLEY